MTTKEIAEFFGKSVDTIQRAAKASSLIIEKGKRRDFSKEETGKIAEKLYNTVPKIIKNAIDEAYANAEVKHAANADESRIDRLERITEKLVSVVLGLMPEIKDEPVKALPPPPLSTRDELRRIINKAGRASGDYSGGWNLLYQEIYYRMHRNVKECAKNRDMDTLDYIEAEGILPEVVAIAREIFA